MSEKKIQRVGPAALLRSYTSPHFKTMKISVNMLVPLKKETAALYGILPGLVTRATKEYPDFMSLNRRLSELYGASLSADVQKMGDWQCLTVSTGGIASRYAFGGEDMFTELSELLFSALFQPFKDPDGLFPEDHFLQEQRQLLELKDSEYNDKMIYAHQKCESLLLKGSNGELDRYGSREDIQQLDCGVLTHAWEELLSGARFEVFVLGDCEPDLALFQSRFLNLGTPRQTAPLAFQPPQQVCRVTEEQPLSQSKLSLGFRVDAKSEERQLYKLMSVVLGGGPSSKLFQNVREKMGLCYYCSSLYSALSRSLYIESGVETENLEKAENGILEQLNLLQAGKLTEEELSAAKLALCNSFRSVGDSLNAVETWYLSKSFAARQITPEEAAKQVMSYTADQVIEAANKVKLGAVYRLKGCEVR